MYRQQTLGCFATCSKTTCMLQQSYLLYYGETGVRLELLTRVEVVTHSQYKVGMEFACSRCHSFSH